MAIKPADYRAGNKAYMVGHLIDFAKGTNETNRSRENYIPEEGSHYGKHVRGPWARYCVPTGGSYREHDFYDGTSDLTDNGSRVPVDRVLTAYNGRLSFLVYFTLKPMP